MGLLGQIDMELQKDLIDFVKTQKESRQEGGELE